MPRNFGYPIYTSKIDRRIAAPDVNYSTDSPIGMARRMPDGPAHGLPPACGTPASRCPRACLA
eukprot:COSAG01_NODE_45409_length_409_cov_3.132258_1_plen_62_part_10